jgi:hypothetical protein
MKRGRYVEKEEASCGVRRVETNGRKPEGSPARQGTDLEGARGRVGRAGERRARDAAPLKLESADVACADWGGAGCGDREWWAG